MARSAKTEQVMNLVGGGVKKEKPNPLIKNKKQTSKPVRPRYIWLSGCQMINIVTFLINQELGTVLERFHVCQCGECCKLVTELVAGALPPIFVKAEDKTGEDKVNEQLEKYRPFVVRALTKAVMAVKLDPPHKL